MSNQQGFRSLSTFKKELHRLKSLFATVPRQLSWMIPLRHHRVIRGTPSMPISKDKASTYGGALSRLKREGKCPPDLEHRQVKYKNNVIECDHGKLKRIIRATLGFKSMKTAYATIKGIEVMRALRKGQASSFYYGQPQGEVYLVNRVFGL